MQNRRNERDWRESQTRDPQGWHPAGNYARSGGQGGYPESGYQGGRPGRDQRGGFQGGRVQHTYDRDPDLDWHGGRGQPGNVGGYGQPSWQGGLRDYGRQGWQGEPRDYGQPSWQGEQRGYGRPGDVGGYGRLGGYGNENRFGGQGWSGQSSAVYGQGLGPSSHGQSARQSHRGRGPRGYQRSDERIREEVCDCLTDHHEIDASEINVEVKDGEVTLTGTVDERRVKFLAEQIAESVGGVQEIHNQLRVRREGLRQELLGIRRHFPVPTEL